MKRNRIAKVLLVIALSLTAWLGAQAQTWNEENTSVMPEDSIIEPHWFRVHGLVRTYGDSIVLRWAPDEYVSWRYLNGYGYKIKRMTVRPGQDPVIDSTEVIRPWPRSRFLKSYAEKDSLAAAAVQVLYGRTTELTNTEATSTSGSIMEVYDEQQNIFGYAMMVAEMRPDLAKSMGLGYVDRDVKPGTRYMYTISPVVPDSILLVRPFVSDVVTNEPYQPKSCELTLSDSIVPPSDIILEWPFSSYSAYDIERRVRGENDWKRLNDHPYISMTPFGAPDSLPSIYYDRNLEPGVYEYRLRGYDSFGDVTGPSEIHTVVLPDLVAPATPVLKRIVIDRPGDQIFATLEFHMPKLDEDLIGYIPFYSLGNETDPWIPLSADVVVPPDSSVTVEVTPYPRGMVTIAAIDSAGNVANSLPMPIDIEDLDPPLPPVNLRAACSPEGAVVLVWTPSPSADVSYYDVYTANAPDHTFMLLPDRQNVPDTFALDTISLDVAQRYLYYKVKAVDYSGNNSEYSEMYRLTRPNFRAPSTCLIDSTWQDEHTLGMRWLRSQEEDVVKYILYRSLGSPRRWKKIMEWDADTITDPYYLYVEDNPEPDQRTRYYYAVETFNETGVSSGLSMQTSFLHKGPKVFDIPIKLFGNFDEKKNEVRLAWDREGEIPIDVPYRYVIARREVDDYFRDYTSVDSDERTYIDHRVLAGEKAEYYVYIMFDDGRISTSSNTVKVTNTLKENPPVTEMKIDDEDTASSNKKSTSDEEQATSNKSKKSKKSKK